MAHEYNMNDIVTYTLRDEWKIIGKFSFLNTIWQAKE